MKRKVLGVRYELRTTGVRTGGGGNRKLISWPSDTPRSIDSRSRTQGTRKDNVRALGRVGNWVALEWGIKNKKRTLTAENNMPF